MAILCTAADVRNQIQGAQQIQPIADCYSQILVKYNCKDMPNINIFQLKL